MSEETAVPGTVPENATPTEESEAPTDFREYVRWRTTGELPDKPSAAAAEPEEPPQAKTEPESEPADKQEPAAEEEEDEPGDESAEAKRPGARQRKIDRLTKRVAELEQQVVQQKQPQPPEKAVPAEPAGKPKLADFPTLEAYQEALTDWKMDQREQKHRIEEAERKAQEAAVELQKNWSAREKAARKAHPDYDDVMDTVEAPAGPGVLAGRQAMLEDEHGAEILYYLGKHPAELKRISQLSPVAAVMEIGKLSAALSKSSQQVPVNGKPAVSTAPRPPSPVSRPGKTTSDSIEDPEVQRNYTRWEKARLAQLKG